MRQECRVHFLQFQRKPLVSDPDMHHDTCVAHVPWCMSGSLTCAGEENVPGISDACTSRNCMYLSRGPLLERIIRRVLGQYYGWWWTGSIIHLVIHSHGFIFNGWICIHCITSDLSRNCHKESFYTCLRGVANSETDKQTNVADHIDFFIGRGNNI